MNTLLLTKLPGEWALEGGCRGEDPAIFFPWVGKRGSAQRERFKADRRLALAICGRCPVRQECLDWALHHEPDGNEGGIWGGADGDQRARMRRAAGIRVHATPDPTVDEPIGIDDLTVSAIQQHRHRRRKASA